MAVVRIYVAARAEELDGSQAALVAALQDLNVEFVWSLIGQRLQTETGPLLMSAHGVLCFETASTYHSAEVSFALGDASWEGDGRPFRDRPLPVFAYTGGGERLSGWIWRDERVIRLPTDATEAAKRVVTGLSI